MINQLTSYIFYADISRYKESTYDKYYDLLPPSRKMHVDLLAFEEDKARSVFSYALLLEALKKYDINILDYSFFQNENGKPYLDKCPIKFSISHSGKYVCVSFSLEDVGCDIQEIVKKDYTSLLPILMDDEELKYHSSLNKKESHLNLFNVWCKKESYLKMLGVGVSMSMKSFNASNPPYNANIYSTSFDDKYYISCCYKTKNLQFPEEIKF